MLLPVVMLHNRHCDRELFGLKTDEVTGGRRKLQNEELCNLHFRQV
jgi:hypothetical protein